MGQGKTKYEMNMTKEYLTKESYNIGASLVAQTVKNLPAVQETSVQSLVQEDPLEKEMATHSSIPAWRTGRPQSMASSRVRRRGEESRCWRTRTGRPLSLLQIQRKNN